MKIYFAGSIRGGREKVNDYIKIIDKLEQYGDVLTKHVADPKLNSKGEDISAKLVYLRDKAWLDECDILFAEVSKPSLGIGYELGYLENKNKKIVCMYEQDTNLSAMIKGNNNFLKVPYNNIEELLISIDNILSK